MSGKYSKGNTSGTSCSTYALEYGMSLRGPCREPLRGPYAGGGLADGFRLAGGANDCTNKKGSLPLPQPGR